MKSWLSTQMLKIVPLWLSVPLGGLGAFFIVMKPLGFPFDWTTYIGCLILAVVAGAVTHRYYELTVVEGAGEGLTFQVGRRPDTVVDPTDPLSARRSARLWWFALALAGVSVWLVVVAEMTRLPGSAAGWSLAGLIIATVSFPIVWAANRLLPNSQVLRRELER
jgi:hypothetical protein